MFIFGNEHVSRSTWLHKFLMRVDIFLKKIYRFLLALGWLLDSWQHVKVHVALTSSELFKHRNKNLWQSETLCKPGLQEVGTRKPREGGRKARAMAMLKLTFKDNTSNTLKN
jgi:hypothetical protein